MNGHIMKLKEIRNDQGLISGVMISTEDFKEVKASLKPNTTLFQYMDNLQASIDQQERAVNEVMANGRTVAETNELTAKATLDVYRNSFSRNVPVRYKDERTLSPDEFVQANPDGSEDLVKYNLTSRSHTVIKRLVEKGKGNIYQLLTASL